MKKWVCFCLCACMLMLASCGADPGGVNETESGKPAQGEGGEYAIDLPEIRGEIDSAKVLPLGRTVSSDGVLYLYSLATTKQYGICNIKIYGTVKSGSASAKAALFIEEEEEAEEEATAVQEVQPASTTVTDDAYYTLSGTRVRKSDLRPGTIYLHKGRKFVMR